MDLLLAVAGVEKAAEATPNAASLQARAIAEILTHRIDAAVDTLEEAISESPAVSSLQCDLSAALLVRSEDSAGHETDLLRALEASQKGITISQQVVECWFNRALAMERIGLQPDARSGWEDYLSRERDDTWVTEGRRHIEHLQAAPAARVAESFQHRREYVDYELLGDWADDLARRDHQSAARHLELAAATVATLPVSARRLSLFELRLIQRSPAAVRATLADAHRTLRDAVRLFERNAFEQAAPLFGRSAVLFSAAHSPFRLWCRLYSAQIAFYASHLDRSESIANSLLSDVARGFDDVEVRVRWTLGLIHTMRGRYARAEDEYGRALSLASDIGEEDSSVFLKALLGELLDFTGQVDSAWRYRLESLRSLERVQNPRRRYSILVNAANAATRQGFSESAVYLESAAVRSAEDIGTPAARFETRLYRARILERLGHHSRALSDLLDAEHLVRGLPKAMAGRFAADLAVAKAVLGAERDPDELESALRFFRDAHEMARVAAVEHVRATNAVRRGDVAGADVAFRSALTETTARVGNISPSARLSYADESWDIFRDASSFFLDEGRVRDALATSELARRRLSTAGERVALETLDVPTHIAVVYFFLDSARLRLVLLTSSQMRVDTIATNPAALSALITRVRTELEGGRRDAKSRLADLFDVLCAGWIDSVPKGDSLLIVPDGPLYQLPFAALFSRKDNSFLIERNPITLAHSLAAPVTEPMDGRWQAHEPSVLAVSVSNGPSWARLHLDRLPAALEEAREVTTVYPHSRMLSDEQATSSNVRRIAPDVDVVHFAAHSKANPQYPTLSWLALWPDRLATDGLFFAEELSHLHLHARVVFLSSCESSAGPLSRSEGILSLARAAQDAGARTVIGAAWPIADEAGRQIAVRFHKALVGGLDPDRALREAQLQAIKGTGEASRLEAWSAFAAYGRP